MNFNERQGFNNTRERSRSLLKRNVQRSQERKKESTEIWKMKQHREEAQYSREA